ncbi:MAG: hypothetical protein JWL63_1525 [Rhodocyclales bacterium]|nr:hypothetical protein [Rhodocyclales bacterium]
MAEKSDLVINHLEVLYKHRELVAAAYHNGSADTADDPDGGRGLARLNQARILVPYREGSYRLASSFTRHLDEVLQIERLYSAAGSNLAELAEHLPDISTMVSDAAYDGNVDDVDRYIDEFDRRVFEIADSVTGALQSLRVQADNNFANVSSYAEKRKQNEFYMERVKSLSLALGAIHSGDLVQSLEASPEGGRMLDTYRFQIADHLPQWRANLLDITAILRDYLFRTRQIELIARRMRSFELFLRRSPGYVPPDIEIETEAPSWAGRAIHFPLIAHADVQDSGNDELLLEIARSIPDVKALTVAQPRLGTLLPDSPIEQDADEAQAMFWERAVRQMLEGLGREAVSATAWKAGQAACAGIADDIWLLCLLHEEANGLARNASILFEHITLPTSRLSGNILLADIRLSKPEHA